MSMKHEASKPSDGLLIETKALTKVYGEDEAALFALAEVDLKVKRGEFVAIMGHSGSGKSTLLNILGCLDRPTSGSYMLEGRDISRLSKNELARIRNQKLGFIFQSFNLLPRFTALANVMLPMLYNPTEDISKAEAEALAKASLESVGLGSRIHAYPNQLSGGQQQRVAIARALVNNPALILADEPTGNLDTKTGDEVIAILESLHSQGATIVMVTHEADIAQHAQRIICVRDGKIISETDEGCSQTDSQEVHQ